MRILYAFLTAVVVSGCPAGDPCADKIVYEGGGSDEVYLAGVGWVRFEPTPGRGAPGDQAYTGVPFQQTAAGDPTTATTVPVPTTAVPGTSDATPVDPADLGDAVDPGLVEQGTAGGASSVIGSAAWHTLVRIVVGLLVTLTLLVAIVPTAKVLRRAARRRSLRGSGRGQVTLAWEQAIESLGLLQVPVSRSATPSEIAILAARTVPDAVRVPLGTLAGITTEARYAAAEPSPEAQAEAASAADTIRRVVEHRVTRMRRMRRALDPRPLFPGTTVTAN